MRGKVGTGGKDMMKGCYLVGVGVSVIRRWSRHMFTYWREIVTLAARCASSKVSTLAKGHDGELMLGGCGC